MGVSVVSSASARSSDFRNVTATLSSTGSNLIVVAVSCVNLLSPTLTDSAGNTFTALTRRDSTPNSIQIYYCSVPTTSGTHSFTASTPSQNSEPSIAVWAFSGMVTSSVFQTDNGGTASSATSVNAGSITPTFDGSLIVSILSYSDSCNVTIPTSFTQSQIQDANNFARGVCAAYYVQGAHAAINPAWAVDVVTGLAAADAAFKVLPVTTTLTPASSALALTALTSKVGWILHPTTLSATLTGQATKLTKKYGAQTGSLVLTGQTSPLSGLHPAAGALTLTGVNSHLKQGLAPNPNPMFLSGVQSVTKLALNPASSSITLTGIATHLTRTINQGPSALTLTPGIPLVFRYLTPASSALTLTGQPCVIFNDLAGTLHPLRAQLFLTSGTTRFRSIIRPTVGSLTLTGFTTTHTNRITPVVAENRTYTVSTESRTFVA